MPSDRLSVAPAVQIQPAYTVQQFGAAFGVGRSKTYVEIGAGRLRAFKVGGRTLIAGEDALAWRDHWRAATPG